MPNPQEITESMARVKEASIYDKPNQLAIKDCKTILAALEAAEAKNKRYHDAHRWDIEEIDGELRICRGNHGSSDSCRFEYFVPSARATRAEARCKELEATGDAMYRAIAADKIGPQIASSRAWGALVPQ